MLILGGLGFIASWLFSLIIFAETKAKIAGYLGLVVAVTLPTLTAFGELAMFDRHTLYSRRNDIGFAINASAILIGVSLRLLHTIRVQDLSVRHGYLASIKSENRTLEKRSM
jgi:hypothetical protein